MWPDDQVKAWVHTSRKDFKADFSGSCTYLSSKISSIFQKNIPGLRNTVLPVRIRQTRMVTRDVFLHLHQAAVSIIKAGSITDLTSHIPHGIILQMNGISYIAQLSPSCFLTQRGLHQERKNPVTKRDPQMWALVQSQLLLNLRKI